MPDNPYYGGEQLECRVVLTRLPDGRVRMAMADPLTGRVEQLGVHGPSQRAIDEAVRGLKASIERAGHKLTVSYLTGPR